MYSLAQRADAHHNWKSALKVFEDYRTKFTFDSPLEYKLGLLYDHAILHNQVPDNTRDRWLSNAKSAYLRAIQKDSSNPLSYLGLARCAALTGKDDKAIALAKLAFQCAATLPHDSRGALGVGQFFENAGKSEEAEKWYEKELLDLGTRNLGANANLMLFYYRHDKLDKAVPYARRVSTLLNEELQKPIYRTEGESNETVSKLRHVAESVLSAADERLPPQTRPENEPLH